MLIEMNNFEIVLLLLFYSIFILLFFSLSKEIRDSFGKLVQFFFHEIFSGSWNEFRKDFVKCTQSEICSACVRTQIAAA